ncbi:MAG: universal stress protein UspE [Pseudomonadota bacterium]
MFECNKILAVFNPTTDEQPALERAVFLARSLDCQLYLVSCIYDDAYDSFDMLTTNERESLKLSLLEKQTGLLKQAATKIDDIDVKIFPVWERKLHIGIIESATAVGADLIVKSCKAHDKFGHKLFTPSDWHLLRESPINVLMVKTHYWPDHGKIVSALSVDANDNEHQRLNMYITKSSQSIANALNAELHFANTYVGAPVHIAVEVPSFSADEYNKDIKEKHFNVLKETATSLNLTEDRLHVDEGLPEDVIPELCEKLDAELLVVGSVGRTGLSAAFLGNTAEHIIDKIDCDTLVIKADA